MLHLTRSDSKILIFNNSRNTLAILMSKDTANTMNKYFTLIEKHQMNAVDKIPGMYTEHNCTTFSQKQNKL